MFEPKIQPLVVTPHPFKCESAQGFLLRTTELNGYDTPSDILRLANLDPACQRSIKLPVEKLAPLYYCDPSELAGIDYRDKTHPGSHRFLAINSHTLRTTHTQVKNPRFCLKCAQEKGYIDNFWDVRFTVACPKHGNSVIDKCLRCNKKLSWSRSSIYECGCGHKLVISSDNQEITESVRATLSVLYSKFQRVSLDKPLLQNCGFPVSELEKLSLQTYLALIDRFGNLNNQTVKSNKQKRSKEWHAIEVTAAVLENWPYGFYKLLHGIGNDEERIDYKPFGLRKQFEGFYTRIFKSKLPSKEIQFIFDAFVEFGRKEWKRSAIDKRLQEKNKISPPSIVGLYDVAKIMNVQPRTVRKMVEIGALQPEIVCNGSRKRMLFNIDKPLPRRINSGESLSPRTAAKRLEIPVNVLSVLRQKGIFKVNYLGDKLGSFHSLDINEFRHQLLGRSPKNYVKKSINMHKVMCVDEVMALNTGGPEYKAGVLSAIVKNQIDVVGNTGIGIGSLILNKKDVKQVIRNIEKEQNRGLLAVDAAESIHCDPSVLPWLVENHYLDPVENSKGLRITVESVERFVAIYRSCAYIAKIHRTSSRSVKNICDTLGISTLVAKRKYLESSQAFVKIHDYSRLAKYYGAPLLKVSNLD